MVAVLFLCCCASGVWGSNNPDSAVFQTQTFSCSRPTWIFTGSSLPSNSAPGGAVLDTGAHIQQVLGAAAPGWGRQGSLHSLGTQPVSRGGCVTHHSFPNLYSPLSPRTAQDPARVPDNSSTCPLLGTSAALGTCRGPHRSPYPKSPSASSRSNTAPLSGNSELLLPGPGTPAPKNLYAGPTRLAPPFPPSPWVPRLCADSSLSPAAWLLMS